MSGAGPARLSTALPRRMSPDMPWLCRPGSYKATAFARPRMYMYSQREREAWLQAQDITSKPGARPSLVDCLPWHAICLALGCYFRSRSGRSKASEYQTNHAIAATEGVSRRTRIHWRCECKPIPASTAKDDPRRARIGKKKVSTTAPELRRLTLNLHESFGI